MNLYFRLAILLLWKMNRVKQAIKALDTSRITFRVLPTDCDLNMHMTNSRYLAMMDLGRTWMISEMKILKTLLDRKWLPIANASTLTFIKEIRPFQRFDIETRIIGWDEKYFYIEQRFVSDRGLHAIGYIRGLFVGGREQIDIKTVLGLTGFEGESPLLPEEIIHWKHLLDAKKKNNSRLKKVA